MMKSDEHMTKVKSRLLKERREMVEAASRRKQRCFPLFILRSDLLFDTLETRRSLRSKLRVSVFRLEVKRRKWS